MFLNLETDYAIRIIDCLSDVESKIDAKTIADETGVTPRFTLKILHRLVSSGLVKSYKGAKGGYILAKAPGEITLLDVVEEMCGNLDFNRCQGESAQCTNPKGICRFRKTFDEISDHMRESFSNVTFKK